MDSLWYTHHRDYQLVLEWMSSHRNQKLRPENFPEYDVTEIPENITFLSKQKLLTFYTRNSLG